MSITLGEIAQLVAGQLHGDPNISITGAAIIRDATRGDITLADNAQLEKELVASDAMAAIVPRNFSPESIPHVAVDHVQGSFAEIVKLFRPIRHSTHTGISAAAYVSKTAKIASGVVIHPGASVDDDAEIGKGCVIHRGVHIMPGCKLGDNVTVFPNVVLYENTIVGNRVIIHAGAVIGAYGFGYDTIEGRHVLSAQLGYVTIGDDVEIGAATTIDRGTYGPTSIGAGTKIDNLVMIAHNCRIGKHNMICSQVGVAGSCTTGDYVVMAGQVGLRDHIDIGDKAMLGAKAGVMHDIPESAVFYGIPATPEREQMVKQAAWSKLPEMRRAFKTLQKQVAELSTRVDAHRDAA